MTEALGVGGGGKPLGRSLLPKRLTLACALFAFGCGGGQTGQPSSANCDAPAQTIPVDRAFQGVVPLDVARKIEGTHTARFGWTDGYDDQTSEGPEDELALMLTYEGGPARYTPCAPAVQIEMRADVSLRDSGLAASDTIFVTVHAPDDQVTPPRPEHGATLPNGPTGRVADFWGEDGDTRFSGGVLELPSGIRVIGQLSTDDPFSPTGYGRFPPEPLGCPERVDIDGPELTPGVSQILGRLSGPGAVPWGAESFTPPALYLSAVEATACQLVSEVGLPITGTLVPSGGDSVEVSGVMRLVHGLEDPAVAGFSVLVVPSQDIPSELVYPDDPPCSLGDVQISLVGIPSADGSSIEFTHTGFFGGCRID
jgi:hypothetical protein